ncbi:MAG: TatD family hydrolase [Proteobacteria bacterium]|nr:TatD family hydrolase [Pseudomonadota bacterium]
MLPTITDTHCHLDFPDFAADLDGVIARAAEAGVARCITISTEVRHGDTYRAISERFANVWHSIGTHPNHAAKEPDVTLGDVLAGAEHPKCVAIGEAGLDYHYDYAPPALQEASFRMQIEAARQTRLPLIIHSRAADDDMGDILEEEMGKGAFTAVLHCFSSGRRLAERGLALGLYVSFSGILTFKSAAEIQEVAQMAPVDRILVETDAPFLAPIPHRGKRNEPGYTAHTAAKLAALRGTTLEALAPQLEANTNRLFWKMGA